MMVQASDSRKSTPSSVGMRDSVRTSELLKVGREYQAKEAEMKKTICKGFNFLTLVLPL